MTELPAILKLHRPSISQHYVKALPATKPHNMLNTKMQTKRQVKVTCPFQISLVAGVGFEPTTFGLWARRATTAPPRDNNTQGPPIFRETDRFCVQPGSGQGLGH